MINSMIIVLKKVDCTKRVTATSAMYLSVKMFESPSPILSLSLSSLYLSCIHLALGHIVVE